MADTHPSATRRSLTIGFFAQALLFVISDVSQSERVTNVLLWNVYLGFRFLSGPLVPNAAAEGRIVPAHLALAAVTLCAGVACYAAVARRVLDAIAKSRPAAAPPASRDAAAPEGKVIAIDPGTFTPPDASTSATPPETYRRSA